MSKLLDERDNELINYLIETETLSDNFSGYMNLDGTDLYGTVEILNDKVKFVSDSVNVDICIHIGTDLQKYLLIESTSLVTGRTNTYNIYDGDPYFLLVFNYDDDLYVTANSDYLLNICKKITGSFISFNIDEQE